MRVENMSDRQVARYLRNLSDKNSMNEAITFEDGNRLINIIALHGHRIAHGLEQLVRSEKEKEDEE